MWVGADVLTSLRMLENRQQDITPNCEFRIDERAISVYTTREVGYQEQLVCAPTLAVFRAEQLMLVVDAGPTKDKKNAQRFATLVAAHHRPVLTTHLFYLDRFDELREFYPK